MAAEALAGVRRRRCYLVRHGHVEYFDEQGKPLDPRNVPLSQKGAQQAWALGQVLQDARVDRALCSDYPRARQTLELILPGHGVPFESLPELREIRAGRLRELERESLPEQVLGAYRNAGAVNARFLGGERWDEFQSRILGLFQSLIQDQSWQSVLIVSHDAVNRVILNWATGLGLGAIAAFEQDPACLNVLDIDTRDGQLLGAVIRTLNYTPYSPHKAGIHDTVLENLFRAIQPESLTA